MKALILISIIAFFASCEKCVECTQATVTTVTPPMSGYPQESKSGFTICGRQAIKDIDKTESYAESTMYGMTMKTTMKTNCK